MIYLGDISEDSVIDFEWYTNDADGGAISRSTDGVISVYKGNNIAQSIAGVTDSKDFDGVTGLNHCRIDTSADPFYETGYDYMVVLTGAVIDTQTVNAVLAQFSIENRHTVPVVWTVQATVTS